MVGKLSSNCMASLVLCWNAVVCAVLCLVQVGIGLPPEESRKRIAGNDRPNGELINASKGAARVLVPSNVPFAQQATGAGTHTQAIQAAVAAAEE